MDTGMGSAGGGFAGLPNTCTGRCTCSFKNSLSFKTHRFPVPSFEFSLLARGTNDNLGETEPKQTWRIKINFSEIVNFVSVERKDERQIHFREYNIIHYVT